MSEGSSGLLRLLFLEGNALSGGQRSFWASRAADGYYYLVCRERVTLRLSENETRGLHNILSYAQHAGTVRRHGPADYVSA
jgi:hypothetical protein